jgi:hypothetical protein
VQDPLSWGYDARPKTIGLCLRPKIIGPFAMTQMCWLTPSHPLSPCGAWVYTWGWCLLTHPSTPKRHMADPSATWRLGHGKRPIGYWSLNTTWRSVSPNATWRKSNPNARFSLLIVIIILLLLIKILIFIPQLIIFLIFLLLIINKIIIFIVQIILFFI